jgi:ABC-type Fe3+-hydroxamate transport system substrate-binding protein
VSLVPSQTELLHYLGLEEETVGITKFCLHPNDWFRNKTRVGGTKTVDIEKVMALKPDLIIANKEENQKEQILELAEKCPLWLSDIVTLEDAYAMIQSVGELTETKDKADDLVQKLKTDFSKITNSSTELVQSKKTAYFIWQKPYMVAGNGTFINEILKIGGFENIFGDRDRYPEVSEEELRKCAPELILLSSEPFPFGDKHIKKFTEICPNATIRLVDGELFSWYGSRLLHTVDYLAKLRGVRSNSV